MTLESPPQLELSDFDYSLPSELIAQTPPLKRGQSRLLRIDTQNQLHDELFQDLPAHLKKHDLLVFNNTKVIKARLYGHKSSGGKVEILIERILSSSKVLAHLKVSKTPKNGSILNFANGTVKALVLGREDGLFFLNFAGDVLSILDKHGHTPLPPYIGHTPNEVDEQRYQTIYAKTPGAVAAPTAGLHFNQALLDELQKKGVNTAFVTLHVGAGTFQPVRVQNIKDHVMHAERYTVDQTVIDAIKQARQNGGRVIAVGTTSIRALESAATQAGVLDGLRCPVAHQDDTRLFITPGYQFKVVDGLITNFHLPQSTLLMLVSAMVSLPIMKQVYQHAIQQKYQFFSYGDAMFIEPKR